MGDHQWYSPYASAFSRSKPNFLKNVQLSDCLHTDADSGFTGTKVIATIGPADFEVDVLSEMLDAGMVGARLDLTWGSLDFHKTAMRNLGAAMQKSKKLCCSMVDVQGRELLIRRVLNDTPNWDVHEEPFTIMGGESVTLTTRTDLDGSNSMLWISYDGFPAMCMPGDTVYIGRYLVCGAESASLYLQVVEVRGTDVICVAQNDATMEGLLTAYHVERSLSGVENLQNGLPLFSERDKACITELAGEFDIDFLLLSYVRDEQDVKDARAFLDSIGLEETKIIPKVATRKSLLAFSGILNEADGIIISRGSLGLDNLPEKMALIQKTLIKAGNLVGKPVLLTRIVDTMINTPRPTRAEATDIANAVLDGVDGFILGAETFRGKYPVLTVSTISKICRSAEKVFDHQYHYESLMDLAVDFSSSASAQKMKPTKAKENGHEAPPPAAAAPASKPSNLGEKGKKHIGFAGGIKEEPESTAAIHKSGSADGVGKLEQSARRMAQFGQMGSYLNLNYMGQSMPPVNSKRSAMSKVESLASSAVKAADKVQASLIVVYTHTGDTARLVAKYRPQMPIFTLVVPHLVSKTHHWKIDGKSCARQCLLTRGVHPMLSAPGHNEDAMLEDAVRIAARKGMVKAHDHVVCIQRIHGECCVKVLSVDALGQGVQRMPQSTGNFASLPGVYGAKRQPLDTDTSRDSIRKPQTLTASPSISDHDTEFARMSSLLRGPSMLGEIPEDGILTKTLSSRIQE